MLTDSPTERNFAAVCRSDRLHNATSNARGDTALFPKYFSPFADS